MNFRLLWCHVRLFLAPLLHPRRPAQLHQPLPRARFCASWSVLRLHGWQSRKVEEEGQSDGPGIGLPCRSGMSHAPLWLPKMRFSNLQKLIIYSQVSFGVGPAAAAFSLGLRTPVDHLLLTFFVLCGLTRLARFNVTVAMVPKDATGKSQYFEGTPIPMSLILVQTMAFWVYKGWTLAQIPMGLWLEGSVLEFHPVVFMFVLHGCLMVSKTIHIPKP
jgi:hypothetical protein